MTASGPSKGKGDLDTVVLRHISGASAEIYLFGATLCSYKTSDGKERIFLSPGSAFDGQKAIRGGVPLVFPQFGRPDERLPQHGFARTTKWALKSVEDSEEESVAVLTLSDSTETHELWPHAFKLEFHVAVSSTSLTMRLRIQNCGADAFKAQALLHTYFHIPEISDVVVRGLIGRTYIDKVAGGERKKETEVDILVPSFTDRVYLGEAASTKDVLLTQRGGSALFAISNSAQIADESKPCDVVVWNPYEGASPGDLPVPSFKQFICIEPGLVGSTFELPTAQYAELEQRIFAL